MRRRLPPSLALLCVLILTVAAPAQAVDRAGLRATLATLHPRLGSDAGAYVVDLSSGEPIYAHRENLALAPASNEKLFVTATALLRFGSTGTLTTELRAAPDATIDANGVLHGNLYLVGGGDPTLDDAGLSDLADQVAGQGITRIDGAVIGDESRFDSLRGGPDSAYRPDFDLGGWLSALSWRHGRSSAGGPASAAAARFADLLKQRAVRYTQRPRVGRFALTAGLSLTEPLATLLSPPMGQLIAETNVPSENFYAEMLTKDLGAAFGAGGTTAAGLNVVRTQMATFGVRPRLVDGSGLSHANRTTPRQVVRLLERMDAQDAAATWTASLAVAGRTGTLRKRMRGSAAAGRCVGKTGTLIGVSALSGYCTTTGGVPVAFSFLANRVCTWCAKRIEDRMVTAIARLDG